jgi:hypothetical protein
MARQRRRRNSPESLRTLKSRGMPATASIYSLYSPAFFSRFFRAPTGLKPYEWVRKGVSVLQPLFV